MRKRFLFEKWKFISFVMSALFLCTSGDFAIATVVGRATDSMYDMVGATIDLAEADALYHALDLPEIDVREGLTKMVVTADKRFMLSCQGPYHWQTEGQYSCGSTLYLRLDQGSGPLPPTLTKITTSSSEIKAQFNGEEAMEIYDSLLAATGVAGADLVRRYHTIDGKFSVVASKKTTSDVYQAEVTFQLK